MKWIKFRETGVSPAILLLFLCLSCGKSDSPGPPADPCASVNITVSVAQEATLACKNTGRITVTASGSSNLQYSINGSTFQSSNIFENVAKGQYTVTVKNASNCSKTATVTVAEGSSTAGPLFTAAKSVIGTVCVTCHTANGQQPNPNFTIDCNIVANAQSIKLRAVDLGTMPPTGPLSQADKDKISAWVAAGGRVTD